MKPNNNQETHQRQARAAMTSLRRAIAVEGRAAYAEAVAASSLSDECERFARCFFVKEMVAARVRIKRAEGRLLAASRKRMAASDSRRERWAAYGEACRHLRSADPPADLDEGMD